jgi:hypothetical protein
MDVAASLLTFNPLVRKQSATHRQAYPIREPLEQSDISL